jgi:hypothetical protein
VPPKTYHNPRKKAGISIHLAFLNEGKCLFIHLLAAGYIYSFRRSPLFGVACGCDFLGYFGINTTVFGSCWSNGYDVESGFPQKAHHPGYLTNFNFRQKAGKDDFSV